MKTFLDAKGRTWPVIVDVSTVKRVRELIDVNVLEIADIKSPLLDRLTVDPILLADVLYCLVKPEADRLAITDEDFGRGLAGDAIDRATEALLVELVDFFPSGRRQVLRAITEKAAALRSEALTMAMQALANPETDRKIRQALGMNELPATEPMSNMPAAGNLPASPASIPDPTRSAS